MVREGLAETLTLEQGPAGDDGVSRYPRKWFCRKREKQESAVGMSRRQVGQSGVSEGEKWRRQSQRAAKVAGWYGFWLIH